MTKKKEQGSTTFGDRHDPYEPLNRIPFFPASPESDAYDTPSSSDSFPKGNHFSGGVTPKETVEQQDGERNDAP